MQSEDQREEKKNEDSLREIWDTIKGTNIYIMGMTKSEERKEKKMYLKK